MPRNPGRTVTALGTSSNTVTYTEESGSGRAVALRVRPGAGGVKYLVGNTTAGAPVTNVATNGVVTYTEDGGSRTATARVLRGPAGISYVTLGPGGFPVTAFASGGTVTFTDESGSRAAVLWLRHGADGVMSLVAV